eukprot:Skav201490  [mRNA]  locus=scaffold828:269749:271722:- [translate_table: standard]
MEEVVPLPFALPATHPWPWTAILQQIAQHHAWKALVTRAYRNFLQQEHLAWSTWDLHRQFLMDWTQDSGHHFDYLFKAQNPAEPLLEYECPTCRKCFPSHKQRSIHQYASHGVIAQERAFVQSTICGACLRDFRTSHRLQQHYRYRPNLCFERILLTKEPDTPEVILLPEHLTGVARLPCVRHHHGPLRPTLAQYRRSQKGLQIWELKCALGRSGLEPFLTTPRTWDRHFQALDSLMTTRPDDPLQLVMNYVDTTARPGMHQDIPFLAHWLAAYDSPTARLLADVAPVVELLTDHIPEVAVFVQWIRLTQQLQEMPYVTESIWTSPDSIDVPPAAPVTWSSWRTTMEDLEKNLKDAPLPPVDIPAPFHAPVIIILHMYSGRRRPFDFQSWAEHYVQEKALGSVLLLSLDTAVSSSMDIFQKKTWNFIMEAARAGAIQGLLVGPPCETWSAARANKLHTHGPRPLRSRAQPWGLGHRGFKELLQLQMGSTLLLRALWVVYHVAIRGYPTVVEHPAEAEDMEAPSIWLTALVQLLLSEAGPCRKLTVEQWRWGSVGVKPTTFMYSNHSLDVFLNKHRQDHVPRPTSALLGKNADGTFRTSRAKEYGAILCRALADALTSRVNHSESTAQDPIWLPQALEFARLSATQFATTWKPDYQPQ